MQSDIFFGVNNKGTLVPADEVDPVFEELSKKMNKVRNKAEHDISLGATMDQAMSGHTIVFSCFSFKHYTHSRGHGWLPPRL